MTYRVPNYNCFYTIKSSLPKHILDHATLNQSTDYELGTVNLEIMILENNDITGFPDSLWDKT